MNGFCERQTMNSTKTITKTSKTVLALLILALLIVLSGFRAADTADSPSGQPTVSPERQKRIDAMKMKGPDASLTVLPVRLAGQPSERVTEVVGLLLEQHGLKNIELGKAAFQLPDKAGLEILAGAVGEFVKKNSMATSYALYAEYNGNPQTGLNELRAVVVDQAGAPVWTDRQTAEDTAFKRLGSPDPMAMSVLLVKRLGPQLGLNEETAKAAKPGKMARIMDERSGLPTPDERSALKERQKEMKKGMPKAALLVFSARVGGVAADPLSANDLAGLINTAKLSTASPAGQALLMKASQGDPNELKALWNLAREFRDYARNNPPEADYVLYADYVFNSRNWEQGYLHFVVCDRKGEWVIVDMQNSHHPDYRNIKPTSRADCDKLLVKRLANLLR
jgi:hypothetical protein